MNTFTDKTRQPFPRFQQMFFFCGLLLALSEIWKQWYLTFPLNHGNYNWWYFPFQLCSIPMYLLLLFPFVKKERIRNAFLTFLMCYGMLGGIAVFADTSGLHYPVAVLTVHSYLWHILLIVIGITAGTAYGLSSGKIQFKTSDSGDITVPTDRWKSFRAITFREFTDCTLIYAVCCVIASIINAACNPYGEINMFYINPRYTMVQIVFCDFVPYIGNTLTIFLYMTATVLGGFLLFCVWNLLFPLWNRLFSL